MTVLDGQRGVISKMIDIRIFYNSMKITKKQVFENLEEVENEEKVAIKIKNRFNGSVIYESSKNTYKEAVVDALARG